MWGYEHVSAGTYRGKKRQILRELEFMWMLGTDLESSIRATHDLNLQGISPIPILSTLNLTSLLKYLFEEHLRVW